MFMVYKAKQSVCVMFLFCWFFSYLWEGSLFFNVDTNVFNVDITKNRYEFMFSVIAVGGSGLVEWIVSVWRYAQWLYLINQLYYYFNVLLDVDIASFIVRLIERCDDT